MILTSESTLPFSLGIKNRLHHGPGCLTCTYYRIMSADLLQCCLLRTCCSAFVSLCHYIAQLLLQKSVPVFMRCLLYLVKLSAEFCCCILTIDTRGGFRPFKCTYTPLKSICFNTDTPCKKYIHTDSEPGQNDQDPGLSVFPCLLNIIVFQMLLITL